MPRDTAQDRGVSGSRPVVSGYFLYDEFNGVDATDIANHAPDAFTNKAGVWVEAGPAPTVAGDLSGNALRLQDNGDGQTRWLEFETLESEGIIEVRFRMNSINPAWGGIMFRGDGSTRWHFRDQHADQLVYLYDPTGANQSIALATSVSDALLYTVAMSGTLVVAKCKNINTGVEVVISNNGGLNRIATRHGITSRTVFGAGASDFYDYFKFSVK